MSALAFVALGTPAAQGSKRHVGNGRMVEQSKKVKPWRKAVAEAAAVAMMQAGQTEPMDGDLSLMVWVAVDRPKTVKRDMPNVRPDLDKIVRAVCDALTTAGAWVDDGRCVAVHASKEYVGEGFMRLPASGAFIVVKDYWEIVTYTADDVATLVLGATS